MSRTFILAIFTFFISITDKIKVLFVVRIIRIVDPRLFIFVFVEVFDVNFVLDFRNEWWGHLFEISPVHITKPSMFLYFSHSIVTQPMIAISNKSADQINDVLTEVYLWRKEKIILMVLYFVINLLICFSREGSKPDQHLIYHNTDRPPVHSLIVTFSTKHFWSDVIRGSYCTVGQLSIFLFVPNHRTVLMICP